MSTPSSAMSAPAVRLSIPGTEKNVIRSEGGGAELGRNHEVMRCSLIV